jgi:GTPase SAR1 family protein
MNGNRLNYNNKSPFSPTSPSDNQASQSELFEGYVASKNTKRKIVIVGDANVGKSSLISRFVYNSVPSKQKNTVGAFQHEKTF